MQLEVTADKFWSLSMSQFECILCIFCDATQVLAATGEAEYFEMCEPISHLVETAGCLSLMANFDKRHLLVKNLCHFVVVGRSAVAIDQ